MEPFNRTDSYRTSLMPHAALYDVQQRAALAAFLRQLADRVEMVDGLPDLLALRHASVDSRVNNPPGRAYIVAPEATFVLPDQIQGVQYEIVVGFGLPGPALDGWRWRP